MDLDHLPHILEHKRTLGGDEKTFRCRVLDRSEGALCVLFVADRTYQVADLELPPGTITFGHFWAARPYNVYHWLTPSGATLGYYFNVAAETALGADRFSFRDLTIDVLARPGVAPAILDADEIPADLDADLRAAIAHGLAAVLGDLPQLEPALERRADELWPRVFGGARR